MILVLVFGDENCSVKKMASTVHSQPEICCSHQILRNANSPNSKWYMRAYMPIIIINSLRCTQPLFAEHPQNEWTNKIWRNRDACGLHRHRDTLTNTQTHRYHCLCVYDTYGSAETRTHSSHTIKPMGNIFRWHLADRIHRLPNMIHRM